MKSFQGTITLMCETEFMANVAAKARHAITLLASVPLTGEGWRPLAEGEMIVVKDGRVVGRAADGSMQQGDVRAAI
jgi:hypothetical protein